MNVEEFLNEVGYNLKNTIAIDFDGVIHKNSLGFHDGTIYDEPVEGTRQALKILSKKFERIVIFSCKSIGERPLVNGMTGTELVWQWLAKYNLNQYIYNVTAEKPIASLYIDDSAIRFTNWKDIIKFIEDKKIGE